MYKFRPKRIPLYPLVENPQKVHQGTYQAGGEFSSWLIDKQVRSVFRVSANSFLYASAFRYAPYRFAAYQFAISGALLHLLSTKAFAYFEPKSAKASDVVLRSFATCLAIILYNLSTANFSDSLHKSVCASLIPIVVAIDYFLYEFKVSPRAMFALLPLCTGLAMITDDSYSDFGDDSYLALGGMFAFGALLVNAVDTVWTKVPRWRLRPNVTHVFPSYIRLTATVLLYAFPYVDVLVTEDLHIDKWMLILWAAVFLCTLQISPAQMDGAVGPAVGNAIGLLQIISTIMLGLHTFNGSPDDAGAVGLVFSMVAATACSLEFVKTEIGPMR